jgi:hypothetical protein
VKYVRPVLLMMLTTMPLWASSRLGTYTSVVAQVPFEFVVGDKVIPAGECIVQSANTANETIWIRNADAKVGTFSPASTYETRTAGGGSALIFRKYGNRYFLSGIRLDGVRTVYEVPQGRAEAELKAQKAPSVEQTVLASTK